MKWLTGALAAIGGFLLVMFKLEQRKTRKAEIEAVTAENKAQDSQDDAEVKSATDKAEALENTARLELSKLSDPTLPKL